MQDDLLELSGLGEALDDLVGDIGAEVDGEGEGGVGSLDQIPELLAALELVFLQPLLEQLLPALGEHGPAQLQGLELVELSLVQEDPEILQQRRCLASLGRNLAATSVILKLCLFPAFVV